MTITEVLLRVIDVLADFCWLEVESIYSTDTLYDLAITEKEDYEKLEEDLEVEFTSEFEINWDTGITVSQLAEIICERLNDGDPNQFLFPFFK